jgi:hypothetical protein
MKLPLQLSSGATQPVSLDVSQPVTGRVGLPNNYIFDFSGANDNGWTKDAGESVPIDFGNDAMLVELQNTTIIGSVAGLIAWETGDKIEMRWTYAGGTTNLTLYFWNGAGWTRAHYRVDQNTWTSQITTIPAGFDGRIRAFREQDVYVGTLEVRRTPA